MKPIAIRPIKRKPIRSLRRRFILGLFLAAVASYGIFNVVYSRSGTILGIRTDVQPTTLWEYQCIDTMKYSRDRAREWAGKKDLNQLVEKEVAAVADTGANCIAIATPYDEEFWPLLTEWVNAARKYKLAVWYRGNMSGWENWFSYPTINSEAQHHAGITKFITGNAGLFKEGDIFSPAPEAENGKLIGNPWASENTKTRLRNFAVSSTANCQIAFAAIGKKVACGYFSANGDVVEKIYNKDTIKNSGGVAVTDHYVKTSQRFITDVRRLSDVQQAPVFVGEFGAPIPDIHGSLTQTEQAQIIDEMLYGLYQSKSIVKGVNYWTLRGGSTALMEDNYTPRKVVSTIKKYYKPSIARGVVVDVFNKPIVGASVRTADGGNSTNTGGDGSFYLLIPGNTTELVIEAGSVYVPVREQISLSSVVPFEKRYTLQQVNPGIVNKVLGTIYESLELHE